MESREPLFASRIESFGQSELGYVRTNNEDAWKIIHDKHFFILADGMGGHNAGEVAAQLTVESLSRSIDSLSKDASLEETCQFLRSSVSKANGLVYEASQQHLPFKGMGTTLSCFLIWNHFLVYAHIGDSRLYRYRNHLQQLTQDHSLASRNYLKPTSYPQKAPRHVITRAIGGSGSIYPDLGVIPLHPKDIYLLCSDGLSDYVNETKMANVLSQEITLQEMGEQLIKAALEKGGNDNITLLLVQIQ